MSGPNDWRGFEGEIWRLRRVDKTLDSLDTQKDTKTQKANKPLKGHLPNNT